MTTTDIDLNDPAVQARIDSMVRDAGQRFDEWAKTANYAVHVTQAVKAAEKAAAQAPHHGLGSAWATIEITERSKPLIRELFYQDLAEFDHHKVNVRIDLGYRHKSTPLSVRAAAINAFAVALSRPGFELALWSFPADQHRSDAMGAVDAQD